MPKSAQNRRKFVVKMETITTEYGKLSSNKTRTVYLRIRSGKTEKRINTQVKVLESEISPRTKKIKDFSKARQIEMMRLDWETKINQLGIEALGVKVDAQDITSAISKKEEETDFFAYAKNWLAHTSIKGFALRGERFDAHSFLADAVRNGAKALVVEHRVAQR